MDEAIANLQKHLLKKLFKKSFFAKHYALHKIRMQPFFGNYPWPDNYKGTVKWRRP